MQRDASSTFAHTSRRLGTRDHLRGSLAALAITLIAPFSGAAIAQPYTQIAAGELHTCALLDSGAVHCWGDNFRGQLGNGGIGSGQESPSPVRVLGLSAAVNIATGTSHSCAALRDGRVQCWGYNFRGQLGDGSTTSSGIPVLVASVTDAIAVAAGGDHSCALRHGGGVKCWGYNGDGELGHGGSEFFLTSPVDVAGISTATAISARHLHTCARLTDSTLRCWGNNSNGQLGDGTFTSPRRIPVAPQSLGGVSHLSTGWLYTCVVLQFDGSVQCWGENGFAQLGNGGTTDSNSPGSAIVLPSGGAALVAAGENHTCVRMTDLRARCWGQSNDGKLGRGIVPAFTANTAELVLGNLPLAAISNGRNHSCALTAEGSAMCWGRNDKGQLGNGRYASGGDNHWVPLFTLPRCELDIDGNGQLDAATDGVLAARAMLGMSGAAVTGGALGNGATRTTWNQIRNFLIRACGVAGLAP